MSLGTQGPRSHGLPPAGARRGPDRPARDHRDHRAAGPRRQQPERERRHGHHAARPDDAARPATTLTPSTTAAPRPRRPRTATTKAATGTTVASAKVRKPADVKVMVYNASGVQGMAANMSDKLKSVGYNVIDTDNLTPTRTGTTVQCRAGLDAEATKLANDGVGSGATVSAFPANPPKGSDEADCIVILGKTADPTRAGAPMTLPAALQPLVDDASRAALLLDFDGSIAPIVDDPADATPLPAMVDALRALQPVLAAGGGRQRPHRRLPRRRAARRRRHARRPLRARAPRATASPPSIRAPSRGSRRSRPPPTPRKSRCRGCSSSARATCASPSTSAPRPSAATTPARSPMTLRAATGSTRPSAVAWQWSCARRFPSTRARWSRSSPRE